MDRNVTGDATDRVDSVTIRLDYPATFDGVVRDTLTLRRPKVRDMRAAQKIAPGDEEGQELAIFAALAGVSPNDLEGMDLGDYHRVQDAYFRLTSAGRNQPENAQGAGKAAA
ncbi:phage tail assembly protein [Paraburkholderia aspalathi]|uniref:phage tail assembly protein n=1 Tax=Paraburkholderia aspalathi TaxID=1324617 RepID=UPI001FD21820|nr:phage tail assembly protein [Paraburkholderia aspalathi]